MSALIQVIQLLIEQFRLMEQLLSPQIQYYIAMWNLAHAVLAL